MLDLTVVGVVEFEKGLPAVEFSSVFLQRLERLVDFDATFGNSLVVFDVLPSVEIEDGPFQIVDVLLEVLLRYFHLLQKDGLLFLEFLVPFFDEFQKFLGLSENYPPFVHLVLGYFFLELL